MDRREFLSVSAASLAGFALFGILDSAFAKTSSKNPRKYSVVILGDTHFDTEPASVYHSFYNEPVEWLNRVQRAEFARNGEMWRDRCPRLLKRCASLVDDNTIMAFQMGDLIQGDCGKGEVHQKMLNDVMDAFKKSSKDCLSSLLSAIMTSVALTPRKSITTICRNACLRNSARIFRRPHFISQ